MASFVTELHKLHINVLQEEGVLTALAVSCLVINLDTSKDVRFHPKVGQIGPKWDKSGTFQIKFQ